MVCTANDLLEWKDFPKGVRVLLIDHDTNSASQIKSKLQEMDYLVSAFFSEDEALYAISSKNESFHVAIVEESIHNSNGRYRLSGAMKDLPTIIISNEQCLSTMMKCIALGAVEFLIKPISDDKLRNIWQHVVDKAFNGTSESLKSVKQFVGSVLEIQEKNIPTQNQISEEPKNISEKTKQEVGFLDDGDYQESGEFDGKVTKSVDTTNCDSSVTQIEVDLGYSRPEVRIKDEIMLPKPRDTTTSESSRKEFVPKNMCVGKSSRRKVKVDWTSDLHKKFVQAVEQLGVDQAIPSRILELMKVEGLTRHNIASHLQKYRMQRRHILPRTVERRWPYPRSSCQRSYYPYKPVMPAFRSFPTANHSLTHQQVYYPTWGQSGYYPWQLPTEAWHWKPYHGNQTHVDAWGCPVLPPVCPTSTFPYPAQVQGAHGFHNPDTYGGNHSFDLHPGEEEIDKVVKEAISKPWLPLPIGLKPPSTGSVLAELSRQGFDLHRPSSSSSSHQR